MFCLPSSQYLKKEQCFLSYQQEDFPINVPISIKRNSFAPESLLLLVSSFLFFVAVLNRSRLVLLHVQCGAISRIQTHILTKSKALETENRPKNNQSENAPECSGSIRLIQNWFEMSLFRPSFMLKMLHFQARTVYGRLKVFPNQVACGVVELLLDREWRLLCFFVP